MNTPRLTKSAAQLVAEARAVVETFSVEQARVAYGQPGVLFVDIRDVRELQREGTIPGAFHAPRGMLEFWVDPESPYYKAEFGESDRIVLFCQSSWRSALAVKALDEMGLAGVAHIDGGFKAWQAAGGDVGPVDQ